MDLQLIIVMTMMLLIERDNECSFVLLFFLVVVMLRDAKKRRRARVGGFGSMLKSYSVLGASAMTLVLVAGLTYFYVKRRRATSSRRFTRR